MIYVSTLQQMITCSFWSRFSKRAERLGSHSIRWKVCFVFVLACCSGISFLKREFVPIRVRGNREVEATNKTMKIILNKTIQTDKSDWDPKLAATLWAYRTAYKVTTNLTAFWMAFVLEAVVPMEFVVPSLRVAAKHNLDTVEAIKGRLHQLSSLDELRLRAG